MPGLTLIVNPTAGGGRASQLLPDATAALDAAGADYEIAESASLAHAGQLAAAAAAQGRVIVAVGGDGMAGALAAAASRLAGCYGIVPAGRGNDLARVLGIPSDPAEAARLLAHGAPVRQVDLIGVSVPGQPEVIVAGSVYAGVPSVANTIANETRWVRGSAVYTLAALRAVARWHPVTFGVQGAAGEPREFAGYAVVVANSAYFGAGMKVAPPARIDDGILDLVLMRHGPKLAFLRALAKIKDGSHVSLEQVSLDRDTEVTLTISQDMPVAADGETLPFAAPLPAGTPLRIRVLRSALTVIAPSPAEDEPAGAS
ncbi:MAG TPA: diacylglycerol kinase family protein [Streptosporangiaceae bacterium]|nr:diacylglycerol kinase family protein [Streptosporangiaceae bacterium]